MIVLIADDEQLARWRLSSLLAEIDPEHLSLVEAENGFEALQKSKQLKPDIVLLDIGMPALNGIETAKELTRLQRPPAIIFTTAYDEYALQAFDVDAIDYLVKPIRKERLKSALNKAKIFAESRAKENSAESAHNSVARTRIGARIRDELVLISVTDIHFFRSEQKYTLVNTGKNEILIEEPLTALAEEFSDRFVRIHRNALVAIEYIESLEKNADGRVMIKLRQSGARLEVSRRHVPKVRSLLKKLVLAAV